MNAYRVTYIDWNRPETVHYTRDVEAEHPGPACDEVEDLARRDHPEIKWAFKSCEAIWRPILQGAAEEVEGVPA